MRGPSGPLKISLTASTRGWNTPPLTSSGHRITSTSLTAAQTEYMPYVGGQTVWLGRKGRECHQSPAPGAEHETAVGLLSVLTRRLTQDLIASPRAGHARDPHEEVDDLVAPHPEERPLFPVDEASELCKLCLDLALHWVWVAVQGEVGKVVFVDRRRVGGAIGDAVGVRTGGGSDGTDGWSEGVLVGVQEDT